MDEQCAPSNSFTLQELESCVNVAFNVNNASFLIPGLVWRDEWQDALDSLNYWESSAVLTRVFNTFSTRLTTLGSFTRRTRSATQARFEVTGYKRLNSEDLESLKDLLVLTDRESIQAVTSSNAPHQSGTLRLLESSIDRLQLCRELLRDLYVSLESWLHRGRGDHGKTAAMSNPAIVYRLFEALYRSTTRTSLDQRPWWFDCILVSRSWRDAAHALGKLVSLPQDAPANVVNDALARFPQTRLLRCNLSYLNAHGIEGLTALLDALEVADTLETLRIDHWVQCDKPPGATRVITLPRLDTFELISVKSTHVRHSAGRASLLRYLRLPNIMRIAIYDVLETVIDASEGPSILADQLSAIADALTPSSPCLLHIQQFIIDWFHDSLSVRARCSKDPQTMAADLRSSAPVTIRIGGLPRAHPLVPHIFLRFCQLLATRPSEVEEGVDSLRLDRLVITAQAQPPERFDISGQSRRLGVHLLDLPMHEYETFGSGEPAICLFHYENDITVSSVRALEMQAIETRVPNALSTKPRFKFIELNSNITKDFMNNDGLSFADFHNLLRGRVTRGYGIRSITFHGMPNDTVVPQQLQDAAQTWGETVTLVDCQSSQGTYSGKTLIFHPLLV